MCGIHGFTWADRSGQMAAMTVAALHRGPDGNGVWGDHHVTLGHNLLALTEKPELSKQPWVHGGKVLVFNGEVYNYRDLCQFLSTPPVTDSDTEVVAMGLAEHGPSFLDRLDGMFALAFYDPAAGSLLLARDANGAKPLYYGDRPGGLAFSSEIRSLLALGFDRKVSKDGFRHYYHAGLVAGPLTMFDGIRKLVPGQVVEIDLATGVRRSRNLNSRPPVPFAGNPADLPEMVRQGLRQSVRQTLGGRRAVGLLLSGGMDSSAILHESSRWSGIRPRTFSTRFDLPHPNCDNNADADAAIRLARVYHTTHADVTIGENEWVRDFDAAVLAMEEPRQGKSFSAYYATYRFMRKSGVVVVLTGDGGDELLAGYKHHLAPSFRLRMDALRGDRRTLPDPSLLLTGGEQWAYLDAWLPKGGLTGDQLNDALYTECLHTLSEDFLIRSDKLGMAFGMEARFPFLGRGLVDLVRSVPGGMKIGPQLRPGGWDLNNKPLMRRAYTGLLPKFVTGKPKSGWRAPTDDWVIGRASRPAKDGPVRQKLRDVLSDPVVRELFGISDVDVGDRYLNNRDFFGPPKPSGKPSVGPGMASQKELFTVATFASWLKLFNMRLW